MRKIVLAFAAIIFTTTFTYAQETQESQETQATQDTQEIPEAKYPFRKFSWGIKAALNFASEYDKIMDVRTLTAFSAGFVAEIGISNRVSFQPELLYSMQGSRSFKNNKEQQGDVNNVYGYLNLPLMFKFYVWERRLSIEAGPQVGYLLHAKEKRTPRNMALQNNEIQIENKFDIAAGLGVSFKFAKSFDVSARYTRGFMKILKDGTDRADATVKVNNKNTLIQVGMGARF